MGWRDRGGTTRRAVWKSLKRLAETELTFTLADGVERQGKLLKAATNTGAGAELLFDPAFILPVFREKQYKINRARRESLSSPLAKWLHDFASTHSKAREIDLKYLRERCGFHGRPKDFRARLQLATDNLIDKAPALVASVDWKKGVRKCDAWTVSFKRGDEKASYLEPETGGRAAL